MQSKNSLLNKAFIKKDLTRFWPVWAVELVILFFMNMGMASAIRDIYEYGGYVRVRDFLLPWGIVTMLFSIIVVSMLFGYLSSRKEAYLVHSFPVSRRVLFWSHYVSGLLMVLVPLVLSFLIYVVELPEGNFRGLYFFVLFLQICLGDFLCYNLACVSMLLTANRISGVVIYLVLNVIVYGAIFAFGFMEAFLVYGGTSDGIFSMDVDSLPMILLQILTPFTFWGNPVIEIDAPVVDHMMTIAWNQQNFFVFFVWIPAVLLLIAGYYLYKKRAVETAGDMIAFSWAKPVYKAVFTFFYSVLFVLGIYFLSGGIYYSENLYKYRHLFVTGILLSALMGYFVVTMIMEKTFFIWKKLRWFQVILPCACMLCILLFVKVAGGFTVKIPAADSVSYVEVSCASMDGYFTDFNDVFLTDKMEIKELIGLNRNLLKEEDAGKMKHENDRCAITYYLKNGTTRYMSYPVDADAKSVKEMTRFCVEGSNYIEKVFAEGIAEIESMEVYDIVDRYEDSWEEKEVCSVYAEDKEDKEKAEWLYEAMKEDDRSGKWLMSYEEAKKCRYEIRACIRLNERSTKHGEETTTIAEERNISFSVSDDCVHTLQVIEKLSGEITDPS